MTMQCLETRRDLNSERQHQRDGVTTQTHREHRGLLQDVHELERKLATAAPGREREWTQEVLIDLRRLRDSFRDHAASVGHEEGLFDELSLSVPHWIPRMERLQQREEGLLHQMNSLISQFDEHGADEIPDFSEIRRRTVAVINEVRAIQALENDLMFECFETDLGVGD